ncbi:hypothetical protein L5515_001024 [Caenorhabditis briggsae]|uniref:Uncharacterized protein n=1 Tax=Caenorhabditis briggsae TaxID=6238 RepID=A0AAE9E459_CAEBR|nr:hypothetical protein L5515_001024 [Caenorhabditis briggsae]
MPLYKYGIVITQIEKNDRTKWKVAMFDGSVEFHGREDIEDTIFNFPPEPGVSVKVKFENEEDEMPVAVSKCTEFEWIRDVEVVDSKAVIFAIVNLTQECLKQVHYEKDTDIPYYIIQNNDTDFRRIAIPKVLLDEELAKRTYLQRQNEPFIYRVGVCWDPFVLKGENTIHWRCYADFPMVPIFELYYREMTLPYISESMIYGVLEGIVIAENSMGVLYWTSGMGCAVLSNATLGSDLPPLGTVNYVLVKRCLKESSFGFPCFYELLPDTRPHGWERLKIIVDKKHGCIYVSQVLLNSAAIFQHHQIEARCEVVQMFERDGDEPILGMHVPHLGTVHRGLQPFLARISKGDKCDLRIEFQKECGSYVPVVRDICTVQDQFVKCRIVHISDEMQTYFAVPEPNQEYFQRIKEVIDFIAIPFRVMFCSKGLIVEKEELLMNCYTVQIRSVSKDHSFAEAVYVQEVLRFPKDPAYALFNGTVWLREMVTIRSSDDGNIEMLSNRLCQIVHDLSRLTEGKPVGTIIAIQAQFVLFQGTIPVFWVRSVAPTVHQLPRITLSLVTIQSSVENTPSEQNAVFSQLSSHFSRSTAASEIPDLPSESCKELEKRRGRSTSQCSNNTLTPDDVIATESWLASSASSMDTFILDSRDVTMDDEGQVITESQYDASSTISYCSTVSNASSFCSPNKKSAINVRKMSVHGSPPRRRLFGGTQGFRGSLGFGTSSLQTRNRPKMVKYGFRQLKTVTHHENILEDMAYRFRENRLMFAENERDALNSWFRQPFGRVTSTKKNLTSAIPVEVVSYKRDYDRKFRRYTSLVRFIVTDRTMNVCDASIVVPTGGNFPSMPKDFQLGDRYKVEHYSFATDRMCRFGGFAYALNQLTFYPETPWESISNTRTRRNERGHEYLQFKTNVIRPCTPELLSDVFELWSCDRVPGYVIVEKKPELMKCLEPMNADVEEEHVYSAMIEPLAGGPMEISSIIENLDEDEERMGFFVFWRLVVEFSEVVPTVPVPLFVSKKERYIPPANPPMRYAGTIPVEDYGMWKTMHINSVLAQEKMDKLRALGDPRIKMLEGPDLQPEVEVRKVDVDVRRDCMLKAMQDFRNHLPALQRDELCLFVFYDQFIDQLKKLEVLTDNYHPHQTKKRSYSLEVGLNYLTNILLDEDSYKAMHAMSDHVPLLTTLAECISMNTTYIKKTEPAMKMIRYFRKHKLSSFM